MFLGIYFAVFLHFCLCWTFSTLKSKPPKIRWVWAGRKFVMIKLECDLLFSI